MAGFYKVVVQGTAMGQDINNILYYSTATPDVVSWDADAAAELGQDVADAWVETALPLLPAEYSFSGTVVSMVNEDGVTISPFTVPVADTGTGGSASAIGTVAQVLIYKFNCNPATLVNAHPVPRRSYIAFGPMLESQINPGGQIATPAGFQTMGDALFTQGHLVGAANLVPYRVGRTVGSTQAGVGRVVSGIVRPFSSFRRSRLTRPTGN